MSSTSNGLNRRQFISSAAATLALWHTPLVAAAPTTSSPNIVWVMLRGALDSLETVIPAFDPDLASIRPTIALGRDKLTQPLQHGFVLHPALKNLYVWYQNKELLPIVAVGSGYGKRSHFAAQDYLESGQSTPNPDNGWLARASNVAAVSALAVSHSTPMSLRGAGDVHTWYPSKLKPSDDDLYQSLAAMYQQDPELLTKLNDGLKLRNITDSKVLDKKNGRFVTLAAGCGKLMATSDGPNCAMLELGGWDTHNNQNKRLARQLAQLDQGLEALKQNLGQQWQNTLVVVATEFGRTAKENGTKGTDHGTASTMLLGGGAVNGGQVLGQWPGLQNHQLFEQRDLKATSHSFSWLATLLHQHWHLSQSQASAVFDGANLYNQVQLIKN